MVGDQTKSIWEAIRTLNAVGPFTTQQVDACLATKRATVHRTISRLHEAGCLMVVGHGGRLGNLPHRERLFRIAADCDQSEAPALAQAGLAPHETKAETLWRTMKMLKRFTVATLAEMASTEDRAISLGYAAKYCRALAQVGVLARSGGGFSFVQNLGHKAPRLARSGAVYDENARAFIKGGVNG